MDWQRSVRLIPHTVALVVLLIIAVTILRSIFGEPLLLAELGVALLIALVYPRVFDRLNSALKNRKG